VPFDHNDHYHGLLIRHLPSGCRTALDVGCGTGRFARRLARHRIAVHAVDPSAETLERAQALSAGILAPGTIRWERADITKLDLPRQHYDFISCLASIHHMPFDTVAKLRDALAPGGVLAILGLYRGTSVLDHVTSTVAVPCNAVARIAVNVWERTLPEQAVLARRNGHAPVAQPTMTLDEIRGAADEQLGRSELRRLLFWRYLLVYRNDRAADAADLHKTA
jgi:SAM-dependent methyltransferase